MTIGEALQHPEVSADIYKYYGGDVNRLTTAAKAGDLRAQQLRSKIFSVMNQTAPLTTNQPATPSNSAPQNALPVKPIGTISPLPKVNLSIKPWNTNVSGTPSISSDVSLPEIQNHAGYIPPIVPPPTDIENARTAMEKSGQAYQTSLAGSSDFETQLRDAIMKRVNNNKPLYEQKGQVISDLGTVGTRVMEQYGGLADVQQDPFGYLKSVGAERGLLEKNLTGIQGVIASRQGYLDDVIKAGTDAYKTGIESKKTQYELDQKKYENLVKERENLMKYVNDYYTGDNKNYIIQGLLSEVGVKDTNTLIASDLTSVAKALGVHESGSDPTKVGDLDRITKTMFDPAVGKYQILVSNWNNWSKSAGVPAEYQDPTKFLQKRGDNYIFTMPEQIQDFVAAYQLGNYFTKYEGNIDKVISSWNPKAGRNYINAVKSNLIFGTASVNKVANVANAEDAYWQALSIIPTQLKNSDQEKLLIKQRVNQLWNQGIKDPYKIADTFMGYRIEKPDVFSDAIRDQFGKTSIETTQIANVAKLLNAGKKTEALTIVENALMTSAKQIDPDGYVGESFVRTSYNQANNISIELSKLKDSPIGVIQGSMQDWLGRLKGKDAQIIKTKVTQAVADMRKQMAGVAVTETELKFLNELVPQLGDSPDNFMVKLDNLKTTPLLKLNSVRGTMGMPELDVNTLLNKDKRVSLYGEQSGAFNIQTMLDGSQWKQNQDGTFTRIK